MIVVKKNRYLYYKNFKFRCAVGRSGIKRKKTEGDGITPKGTYKIIKIYYRADKIKNLNTDISKIKIKKNMGWCDDPSSKLYNKQIKIPFNRNYEKLYRDDHLYDLVLIFDYNINPIRRNKGSAIFIHISKKNYLPTEGCIALKREDLIQLLSIIKKETKIKIG